jgi:diguanylate cyclase (GGDEF)-like protein
VLVAGAGVWGAVATTQSINAYRDAQRTETAIGQARYALALERTSFRDADVVRGRRELDTAGRAFASQVRRLEHLHVKTGVVKADVGRRHARLLGAARTMFALRATGHPTAADAALHQQVEPAASSIDGTLVAQLARVRADGDDLWPTRSGQKFALGAVAILVALGLAASAVFLLRLGSYRRRLVRARRAKLVELERAALTDSLTGLGNHRSFYEDINKEIARRVRDGSCFGLVMIDLDGLKQINDSLGHQAGDEHIRAVAACLRATLRAGDGAYRTGGDEFMVLLPGERAFGGLTFAQRLHGAIVRSGRALGVSCGIVESAGLEGAQALVRRADLALYEAKRTGRRMVVYSDGIGPRPTEKPEDLALRRHHRLLATALAQAVDAKDAGTRNHCETVSALCVLIGQALGLGGERLEQLRLAGLLHDVGKIGIADALLQKPFPLDSDEQQAMSGHVEIGRVIVAAAGLEEEARWIYSHHERFDGTGYPEGLAGSAIPLESRIILVADAFEAMTADRPYRGARLPAQALDELERRAGSQFDPTCVEALRAVLGADDGLPLPEPDELSALIPADLLVDSPSSRRLSTPKKEPAT